MDNPSDPNLLGIILGWIPMLLLIGIWLFFMRRSRLSSPPSDYWGEQQRLERESLEARRETNRILAELAAKLER